MLKDPHRGRERSLMEAGKRLAYFFDRGPLRDFSDEFIKECHEGDRYLVYRIEDRSLATSFKRTYSMVRRGSISDRSAHARCGILLGYSKEEIKYFLRRGERIQ